MPHQDRLIQGSRFVVRTALLFNRACLCALLVGLISTWLFPSFFADWIQQDWTQQSNPSVEVHSILTGIRLMVLLGIAISVFADRIFVSLAQIIATVSAGDAFILANARRLQIIGWSLLALQLLDIPGSLIAKFFPSLSNAAPDATFSVGGWIAVLMVFVLSRVFAAGAVMRDELEGTV
jgi:Protein of unknown function (DUF2975)